MFRVVELKELALQLLDRIDGEQTKGKLNERVLEEQKDRIETCKTFSSFSLTMDRLKAALSSVGVDVVVRRLCEYRIVVLGKTNL